MGEGLGRDFWFYRCAQIATVLGYSASSIAVVWWTLYTILCKCLLSVVAVQAVTELDNKAAHRHAPVPQRHRPFL